MQQKNLMRAGYAALACLVVMSISTEADASFMLSTSATGVTYSGGGLTSATLTSGEVVPIDGSSITVGAAGGTSYTDSAGTTVYLLNDVRSAGTIAIPNEQIYVTNTTSGATDTGTFSFTTTIAVTYNGGFGSFNEGPSSIMLDLVNGNDNYFVTAGSVGPASLVISGATFTSSLPQAVSGGINSTNNGGVSAVISLTAVPEPASVAMLGMGLVGIGALVARQRRKTA